MFNLLPLLAIATLMYSSSSFGETSASCPGESGYFYKNYRERNPSQGGFVSNQAFVEDSDDVFISPTAAVCGSSSITGYVKIFGTAIVKNATISGNVNIKDAAQIVGANITDNVIISGNARVDGVEVIIREKAQISGNAKITGDAIIGGTAIIGGYARISTGVYLTEILKPGPGKGDIPVSKEEIENLEREKYKKTMLKSLSDILRNIHTDSSGASVKLAKDYRDMLEEFYNRIMLPAIYELKNLMLIRKNAEFSRLASIDLRINYLNNEIFIIRNELESPFGNRLYFVLEENSLYNTAVRIEKIRCESEVYGQTYVELIDQSKKEKYGTIKDAEEKISSSMLKFEEVVKYW